MPNVQRIIQSDNRSKLGKSDHDSSEVPQDSKIDSQKKECNCRKKEDCPLKGQCQKQNIIYQAEVKSDNVTETYIGLTSTTFKSRFNNHKSSFNNEGKKLSTELSKYIWSLKESNREFTVTWKIVCHARPYNSITKKCNLCTTEKYFIICKPEMASLNKRSELISKCRHQNKYLLGSVT